MRVMRSLWISALARRARSSNNPLSARREKIATGCCRRKACPLPRRADQLAVVDKIQCGQIVIGRILFNRILFNSAAFVPRLGQKRIALQSFMVTPPPHGFLPGEFLVEEKNAPAFLGQLCRSESARRTAPDNRNGTGRAHDSKFMIQHTNVRCFLPRGCSIEQSSPRRSPTSRRRWRVFPRRRGQDFHNPAMPITAAWWRRSAPDR